jgi:hypothetical protein
MNLTSSTFYNHLATKDCLHYSAISNCAQCQNGFSCAKCTVGFFLDFSTGYFSLT